MDLHVVAPRCYAVVRGKSEAAAFVSAAIEPGPASYTRLSAIGAHDPTRPDGLPARDDARLRDCIHRRSPHCADAAFRCEISEKLMQSGAANPQTAGASKGRLNKSVAVPKTNAAKRVSFRGVEIDSACASGFNSIGHDALAASLINRWNSAVCDDDVKSAPPRRKCSCQTCR